MCCSVEGVAISSSEFALVKISLSKKYSGLDGITTHEYFLIV